MIYCWKKYLMYLILYCSLEKMDGTIISSFQSPPKTVCMGQSENVLRESQAFELLAGDGTSKVKVLSLNYNINHNAWIWQISSLLFAKLYYFQWNSSIFMFFAEKRTLFSINSIRFYVSSRCSLFLDHLDGPKNHGGNLVTLILVALSG